MTFRWVSPKEGGAEKGLISHLIFLEGVANAAADSRSLLGSPWQAHHWGPLRGDYTLARPHSAWLVAG